MREKNSTMHYAYAITYILIDMIEQNVEQVTINVEEGNRQLERGVTYKVCDIYLWHPLPPLLFFLMSRVAVCIIFPFLCRNAPGSCSVSLPLSFW